MTTPPWISDRDHLIQKEREREREGEWEWERKRHCFVFIAFSSVWLGGIRGDRWRRCVFLGVALGASSGCSFVQNLPRNNIQLSLCVGWARELVLPHYPLEVSMLWVQSQLALVFFLWIFLSAASEVNLVNGWVCFCEGKHISCLFPIMVVESRGGEGAGPALTVCESDSVQSASSAWPGCAHDSQCAISWTFLAQQSESSWAYACACQILNGYNTLGFQSHIS